MLELRPNLECCDRDLAPASTVARICSFESTICVEWADGKLAVLKPAGRTGGVAP